MSEWIEFSKRKPEDQQLIWSSSGEKVYGPMVWSREWTANNTHWMPVIFPDPPPKPDLFEEWWGSFNPRGGITIRDAFNAGREAERKMK